MKTAETMEEKLRPYAFYEGHAKLVNFDHAVDMAESYANEQTQELKAENEKLQRFKDYVHDRLDKMGIPQNPDPENNLAHGCRIEGRLNFIADALSEQHP
jgi:hypothetical protein